MTTKDNASLSPMGSGVDVARVAQEDPDFTEWFERVLVSEKTLLGRVQALMGYYNGYGRSDCASNFVQRLAYILDASRGEN
jgi:spore maturation protein CgeB